MEKGHDVIMQDQTPIVKIGRYKPFYVYMVKCKDGTYYTGSTNNLERRLELHNSGHGAKYLRGRRPVRLVYKKRYRSQSQALKAEVRIKTFTHVQKMGLATWGSF